MEKYKYCMEKLEEYRKLQTWIYLHAIMKLINI